MGMPGVEPGRPKSLDPKSSDLTKKGGLAMADYVLQGKSDRCSREFVRSWIDATIAVLRFHNLPPERTIQIEFCDLGPVWGKCCIEDYWIKLHYDLTDDELSCTVVHELIHVLVQCRDEKTCSTLNAKLRGQIGEIQKVLHKGHYQRAAWLAHRHSGMAYALREGERDHYNRREELRAGIPDRRTRS